MKMGSNPKLTSRPGRRRHLVMLLFARALPRYESKSRPLWWGDAAPSALHLGNTYGAEWALRPFAGA